LGWLQQGFGNTSFLKGACNTVTYSYQSCYNIMILKMFGLDLGDSRSRVSNG
jgi:hypothetical protein